MLLQILPQLQLTEYYYSDHDRPAKSAGFFM